MPNGEWGFRRVVRARRIMEEQMKKIEGLVNTSVDDCKCTIGFIEDLDFLRQLLTRCEEIGHKSRAQVVARRIRQIEKEEKWRRRMG
jgi:hypothetical protein